MHLFIFLNSANKFLNAFYIDKVIYIKLLTVEINLISEFIKISTLVMFYGLYKKINFYLFYINNTPNGSSR